MVMPRRLAAAGLLLLVALGSRPADAKDLRTFTIQGVGSGTPGPITVYFNPKEYTVTKSTPWKHHDIQGLDAPTLEFTSGEPYRAQFDLLFAGYEVGKDVREITDKIERLADPGGIHPPLLITWGGEDWTSRLLGAKTLVVDSDADGTPLSAVVTTLWSAFVEVGDPPPAPVLVPAVIMLADGEVPLAIDETTLELLTLQGDRRVKSHAVEMRSGACLVPRVDFVEGDPQRLRMALVFDTSAAKTDVRKLTERVALLAGSPGQAAPVPAILRWSPGCGFEGLLESVSVRYTLFLDDGTPVRAVMNTVWKEFSPAEEQLKGNPRH